ncbi:MAG TPA: catalase family protein [Blastocatellia bacterium]|nr:catalase family protein [Blastocatellia bacterium]
MAGGEPQLELVREYPGPNEHDYIDKLAALVKSKVAEMYPPGKTLRDVHAKQHGTVRAEFVVEELPEDLRVGVFRKPRIFPALVRFSNGNQSGARPDIKRDTRGLAIKLLGVAGDKILDDEKHAQTQDFLTATSNVLNVKDPAELYEFSFAFYGSPIAMLGFFFNPFKPHLRSLKNLGPMMQKHASLLGARYWSITPYLFGDRAAKYSINPAPGVSAIVPKNPRDCYLREGLAEHLARQDATMDFMIQFQTDPKRMPIENAAVAWDERVSPFRKIATIRIPRQEFDNARQMDFGDNLSFTPWHSLPEHRPLGGINRCRKVLYYEISKLRHDRNQTPRNEPASIDDFLSLASARVYEASS